jgi:acetolactate synthase-1/2/3 large subunit
VILTDAGQPTYVVPQGLQIKKGQRFLAPGGLAEMGWALPAALGAAAASRDRMIVAVIGDGSFQTNIQELQTLRHAGFNVKLFVISNDGYASIRSTQHRFFNDFFVGSTRESGVTLPNLEKIAAAYDLPYFCCPHRAQLREVMAHALAAPGPVICEVFAHRDQDVVPAVASIRMPDGRMRSAPLHEMSPPLPEREVQEALSGGS